MFTPSARPHMPDTLARTSDPRPTIGSRVIQLCSDVAPLVARIALGLPFLRSGMTRWDGFPTLSVATTYLFEEQFQLHVFGNLYPIPAPDVAAFVTAIAEIVLPLLLFAGLATRWAAVGLLAMTAIIQLVVPEGWANFHLYWAALALSILAMGPGPLSLDQFVVRRLWKR